MRMRRQLTESPAERDIRSRGGFDRVETQLSNNVSSTGLPFSPFLKIILGFLGRSSPVNPRADPAKHTVWLLDNTAYQASSSQLLQRATTNRGPSMWQAEVVACIFEKDGREDIGKIVAMIADLVGVDGSVGMDERAVRERIAKRLQPFLMSVVPARYVSLNIPISRHAVQKCHLRQSNKHGIIAQTIHLSDTEPGATDGTVIRPSLRHWPEPVTMDTTFSSPNGWAIISDVDDTIKLTMTSDAIGILRSTFVDDPTPIDGMPQLYYHIQKQLNPTWFYLSASPYNLYPFLRPFIRNLYPHGTLLLRENSWMDLPGLLKSFTRGTQAYKVSRMERVHGWFPQRKIVCIGDSTQSDPEAYAEMYRKQRKWIRAIFIRKVTDVANMEKNKDERFRTAFRGIPSRVWKVFERPEEMYAAVDELRFGRG